jgi:valyl-tRNA synthetase
VTEEVWSWWQEGSVHRQPWPVATDLGAAAASSPQLLEVVAAALAGIRGAKSSAKVSQRTPVESAAVTASPEAVAAIREVESDLRAVAGITGELRLVPGEPGEPVTVETVLGPAPEKR